MGRKAGASRERLGVGDWFLKVLQEGTRDMSTDVMLGRGETREITQSEEDLVFDPMELEKGCGPAEYYEELDLTSVARLMRIGHHVSSAFVHWEGNGEGRRGMEGEIFAGLSSTVEAIGEGGNEDGDEGRILHKSEEGG